MVCRKVVFCPKDLSKYKQANDSTDAYPEMLFHWFAKSRPMTSFLRYCQHRTGTTVLIVWFNKLTCD